MSDQTNLWLYREPNPAHMHLSASHSGSEEKQLPQEPDYDKYAAVMELWSKIHPKAHLSWREGLETARQLRAGERSVSALRRLVTKAMREEITDVEFVRYKFRTASDRHPKDDVSRLIPLALGRLMGMGSPDDADEQALRCPGLWDGHFVPGTVFRPDLRLAVEYADEIMQSLKTARMRDPLELATMEQKATKWLTKLADCLRDATHVEWLRNWTRRFPEVSGHGDGPDGQQSLQFTPGAEPFITHITHRQSLSTGEEMPALDHVAQTVTGQSTVPHSETAVTTCSVEAMLESVPPAAQHDDPEPFPHTEGQLNEEAPASNDQMPAAEGQTSKSIEQPSNPSSLIDFAEAAIANGPMQPYRIRGYDWRTPAKSTPPVRGNDNAPASNDKTPSAKSVGGKATGNAWPPKRIIAFVDDLSAHARVSDRMIARIVDLEDGWYIHRYWPSTQEVASLVREIADKHPRPIPIDLANGLADWEEHGMNV
ncbi:hypothetical protein N5P37_011657 [Trichoderma harzianum]|nr:hypothetical protein N5P37_011657 [Trichoderma harzianum]PKK44479.1 hypothetical protein CI102_9590 [Trichoderma harzianum]